MKKGQKFIMKIDKYYGKDNLLKQGDVIEFVGNKRSSTGMLSVFKNQNELETSLWKMQQVFKVKMVFTTIIQKFVNF
jgi:hypothetical protein